MEGKYMQISLSLAEIFQHYLNLSPIISETIAFVIILSLAITIAWLGHTIFKRYLLRWATKTDSKLAYAILSNIRAPIFLLAILVGVYSGLESFTVLRDYAQTLALAFSIGEILLITFIITRVTNIMISWYSEESIKRGKHISNHLLFILKKVIQLITYLFALVVILGTLGYDLSGIVVGLGVGGIAVALAVQNILSDALTAFSIYFDRPFEVGDFVVIGDYAGTVTKIGIISTRIQLLQGEELIISNKNLIASSVRNFRKLEKRRIVFTVKVVYETPLEKLAKIPTIISNIINEIDVATLDGVHLKQFGDFSIDFQVIYYINTGDYRKYLDTQQQINYRILEEFEKEKIAMAYPTQKIFLNGKT